MSKRKISNAVLFSALLILAYIFIVFPLNHFNNGSEFLISSCKMETEAGMVIGHKMYGLIDLPKNSNTTNIGGFPIAMALFTDGVIVDETAMVETAFGRVNPASKLKKGDFIIELDGRKISGADDIEEVISSPLIERTIKMKVLRGGEEKILEIKPALEEFSNKHRLGLVIRDYLLGVGMVSYVNDDGSFASLGHPISDSIAGRVPIRGGIVYDCDQIGIIKGERGTAGELKVRINGVKTPIGEIYKSTNSGIYGKFFNEYTSTKYSIASRKLVKMGNAFIYAQINGTADFYKIEIIRAVSQNEYSDKGLIVRVTDPRLLSLTGGIVQGMSGSPIIQNDRIIGAVTHVFVNDPTKGYGIYMDFMYEK